MAGLHIVGDEQFTPERTHLDWLTDGKEGHVEIHPGGRYPAAYPEGLLGQAGGPDLPDWWESNPQIFRSRALMARVRDGVSGPSSE